MTTKTIALAASALVASLGIAYAGGCGSSCGSSSMVKKGGAGAETQLVGKKEAKASKDIVDTAVAAGSFETLVAAVQAAGLVDALKADGPLTVFAPTDEAFAKLPEGTVEELLKPENKEKLVDILTYHVVSGKVPAEVAVTLKEAEALNGKKIALEVKDGELFLNESKVVATDVEASNGVIHVIDAVLLPPAE